MLLAAVDFDNLHQVLRVLYDEMMPLCGNMTGVAKGIAGLGALFYVAAKVWHDILTNRSGQKEQPGGLPTRKTASVQWMRGRQGSQDTPPVSSPL